MATLQNIRDRAGLLVAIVIGLALLGFIFTDMGGSNAGRGGRNVAGINGKSISAEDYMAREKSLREFYQLNAGGNSLDAETEKQIQQETWRRLVRETIMDNSYGNLGLYVSTDELKTMITGDQSMGGNTNPALSDPHPIIRQMFANPETGQLNRAVMNNYFTMLDNPQFAQEKVRWLFIEDEIISEKMSEKYFTLVKKGIQPSSLDLKDYIKESGKSTDFAYISKPFNTIADEDITFTESDIKQYYKDQKEAYQQNASRTFQYVVFEVEPSEKDIENAEYWSNQTLVEYGRQSSEQVPNYVNGTSDQPFDAVYYSYKELPEMIRDSVFNASEDQVFGPYRDQESFILSRSINAQMRPDSVRVRHILISPQAYGSREAATSIADSLMSELKNGADFSAIALQFSADESNRAIGGDLGWFREGMMITEFTNVCFENKAGELVMTETSFGNHIIRIEEQSASVRKIQLASIVRNIFASDETNQDYYNRAVRFRGKATDLEKFTEQAREFGLDPRFAPNIAMDQQTIPGIEEPRNIIKWAYTEETNTVSNIFSQSDDKYIVAVLTEAREKGYTDMEKVRAEITLAVKKEKKAEQLVENLNAELAGAGSLQEYGSQNNEIVGEATQVKFANTYVAGVGLEPYVVGASMYLPLDNVSAPLIGENGVFVIAVTNRTEAESDVSADEALKSRLKYTLESRSNYEAYEALVDAAKVEDNRLYIF